MGQLRTGILELQKASLNVDPQIAELQQQQDEFTQQVYEAGKRIEEGINVLVMYVMERLKKEGKSFDAMGDKTLKDIMDSNIMTFGKGIGQAKGDVKAILTRLNSAHKTSAEKLLGTLNSTLVTVVKLKGICDKKKAKWLKSAKYKAKIGTYIAALQAIDDITKKQVEAVKAVAALNQSDTWVERNYKFTQDMTLKQVKGLLSSGLQTNLKDYNTQKEQINGRARKFRDEYKSLGTQFAMMRKWVDEAEEMEKEAEE